MSAATKRVRGHENLVKVACIQFEPKVGHKEDNIKRSLELINEAADNGARLIVLPELADSGYMFADRQEAYELSEEIPKGPASTAWLKVARERKLYIAAGICERAGEVLYNSSILVGPDGYIGTYRKMHGWYEEKLFFEPGDLGFPVFKTPIGRIGICICYDIWFPESIRLLAVGGADIVCVNTNWVPITGQDPTQKPMAIYLTMTAAHTNQVWVAAANRVGVERDQPFVGHSLICNPAGWPVAGPASETDEEILYADCDLTLGRRGKHWNELNVPLRDRRTDFYDVTLGTGIKPHAF